MIHLIWHGRGWVVFVSAFGCSLISELATRGITGDEKYYDDHGGPLALALFTGSAITYWAYRMTWGISKDEDGRVLKVNKPEWIDNSFFFVSMSVWPLITIASGFIILAYRGI